MLADQGAIPLADGEELAAFRTATAAAYASKERAFAEADAETIVTRFYAEDATTVGPDGREVQGRDAFRQMYRRMVTDKTVRIEVWRSYVRGDCGWEWTNFHVRPTDPSKAASTFVILFLWTRRGSEWVCAGDMFVAAAEPPSEA